jgi:hypothetical protein
VSRIIPTSLTAGLTFETSVALDCYPADDGWALTAVLRGPAVIDIVATVEDGEHKLAAAAAVSAEWIAGRYSYIVRASKDGAVYAVETGVTEVLPDLSEEEAGYDGRTHAERTLDAIEAVIEQRATIDQERYRINNRELYRTPIAELMKLRDLYRSEVRLEQKGRTGKLFGAVRVIL